MTTVSNCTLESAAQRVGACRQPPLAPIGGEALVGSQELAESIVAGGWPPFVPLCCVVPTLFGIGDEAGGQGGGGNFKENVKRPLGSDIQVKLPADPSIWEGNPKFVQFPSHDNPNWANGRKK